jgi:hypothetical protein
MEVGARGVRKELTLNGKCGGIAADVSGAKAGKKQPATKKKLKADSRSQRMFVSKGRRGGSKH